MAPEGSSDCFSAGLARTGISLFCAICRSNLRLRGPGVAGRAQFVHVGLGHFRSGDLFSRLRSSTLRGIWDRGRKVVYIQVPVWPLRWMGKGPVCGYSLGRRLCRGRGAGEPCSQSTTRGRILGASGPVASFSATVPREAVGVAAWLECWGGLALGEASRL